MNTKDFIKAYPLTWPEGWKRENCLESSRFGKWNEPVTIAKAVNFILDQLRMMGVDLDDIIISTNLKLRKDGLPYSNQRQPEERGASVWWEVKNEKKVIALDKYDRIADNLWAIGKTLEALRGIERWGGGEILNRTFTGFTALTDQSSGWRSIFGNVQTLDELKALFKKRRSEAHPDNGGTAESFQRVMDAYKSAKEELSNVGK